MHGPPDAVPGPPGSLVPVALYFLRLGAVGFGGPIALAGRMQRDLVEDRRWISERDYLDGLAFAQLAPGPLAAQLAMYLGHVLGGWIGCTVVGIAFVLPSFLIVVALAAAYAASGGLAIVQATFRGIGPVVIALIAVSAARLAKRVVKRDALLIGIFAVVAVWTGISQRELVALFVAAGATTVLARHGRWWKESRASWFLPAIGLPTSGGLAGLLVFFAKAGLFVFGSGLAIVPFLYAGVVQEHRWLTDQQFLDAVAVAMITPGPVVITVAFIGYLVAGMSGAGAAALGIFAPVYIMVVVFAPVFRRHSDKALIRSFVAGVTAAACGAIAGAVAVLGRRSITDVEGGLLAIVALLVLLRWKLPEPLVVLAGGVVGCVRYWLG